MLDNVAGLVRRPEMCRQFGITPRTAREWAVRRYGPPPRMLGGRVYYVQAEIDMFLKDIAAPTAVTG